MFKDKKWTNLSGFCSRCIMSPWEIDGRIPQSWHFRNSQVLIRASSRSVSGRSSILLVRSGISRVPEQFGDKVLLHQYTAACRLTYAIVFCDRSLFSVKPFLELEVFFWQQLTSRVENGRHCTGRLYVKVDQQIHLQEQRERRDRHLQLTRRTRTGARQTGYTMYLIYMYICVAYHYATNL